MSLIFTAKCDLCLREEPSTLTNEFPPHWVSAKITIANNKYPNTGYRSEIFNICSSCYDTDSSQNDLKKLNNMFVNPPSNGLKKLFQLIWKKKA